MGWEQNGDIRVLRQGDVDKLDNGERQNQQVYGHVAADSAGPCYQVAVDVVRLGSKLSIHHLLVIICLSSGLLVDENLLLEAGKKCLI